MLEAQNYSPYIPPEWQYRPLPCPNTKSHLAARPIDIAALVTTALSGQAKILGVYESGTLKIKTRGGLNSK